MISVTTQKSTFLFNLTLAVVAMLAFVIVVEGMVRLIGAETTFQNRFFVLNRALDYPDVFKKDHDLIWRFWPDRSITSEFFEDKTYQINSSGLRGPQIDITNSRPRILTLGNSCTFGWGVSDSESYVRQLEMNLHSEYEVINGGIPGYSSLQGRRFYENELANLKPRIVLIMFGWNDQWAAAGGITDQDQKMPPSWVLDIQNQLNRLQSYRLLKKTWLTIIEPDVDSLWDRSNPVRRVSFLDYSDNLSALCDNIVASGAMPILLTQPQPDLKIYSGGQKWASAISYHRGYNRVVRELAGVRQIAMIDLETEFDRQTGLYDNVTTDFIHFNAIGHELIARQLAKFINDEL